MSILLPRDKVEIISLWKDNEIRRKSYLGSSGRQKKRAREAREGRGSACLRGLSRARSLLSPNTSKRLLRRLPQQNSPCELCASVTVI